MNVTHAFVTRALDNPVRQSHPPGYSTNLRRPVDRPFYSQSPRSHAPCPLLQSQPLALRGCAQRHAIDTPPTPSTSSPGHHTPLEPFSSFRPESDAPVCASVRSPYPQGSWSRQLSANTFIPQSMTSQGQVTHQLPRPHSRTGMHQRNTVERPGRHMGRFSWLTPDVIELTGDPKTFHTFPLTSTSNDSYSR